MPKIFEFGRTLHIGFSHRLREDFAESWPNTMKITTATYCPNCSYSSRWQSKLLRNCMNARHEPSGTPSFYLPGCLSSRGSVRKTPASSCYCRRVGACSCRITAAQASNIPEKNTPCVALSECLKHRPCVALSIKSIIHSSPGKKEERKESNNNECEPGQDAMMRKRS